MTSRDSYTAKQLARHMGVTPRQLRKFFQRKASSDHPVGRGQRYEFSAKEAERITREYQFWRKRIQEKKEG